MPGHTLVHATIAEPAAGKAPPAEPCIMVIFGATGDLTKRLLTPALYNLACDGLLSRQFAIAGMALDELGTDAFRARLSDDIQKFNTREKFDARVWNEFVRRIYYLPGNFGDPSAFKRLAELVARLDAEYRAAGNTLFYMATPPSVFGLISDQLDREGFKNRSKG